MQKPKKRNEYLFKILWSKSYIGVAINNIKNKELTTPLTTFYFWPREDGWKLLKAELDSKPWMTEESKFEILNAYTLIIKYWLENIKNKSLSNQKLALQNLNLNFDFLGMN